MTATPIRVTGNGGRAVELARYTLPDGQRILWLEPAGDRVAICDRPAHGPGPVFLVEPDAADEQQPAIDALIVDYLQQARTHQQPPVTLSAIEPAVR
jgi:hypothetical protein